MNPTKLLRAIKMCITFSLLFSVGFGILVVDRAGASPSRNRDRNFQSSRRGDKVSPDLRGKVRRSRERGKQDKELVSVILQLNGPPSARLAALLRRNGVRVKSLFRNFNSQSVELPAGVVDELSEFSELQTVSLDAEVKSFGHVSASTGADMVRANNGVPGSGVDGTGIGIAVLDSGMDTGHVAFLDKFNGQRIAYSKDFTGQNRIDDPFGHGTHVASIAGGNGRIADAAYLGVAPNAKLINLRVLNSQGSGSSTAVLNALDWVMTNRTLYNIRIVNMSLGTPAIQSYKYDPVCLAVRQLTDAGILVVIAAGNVGKDSLGRKIYGAIHSPGIEPSALTVGASNTYGTATRADDTVTSYSSRGPTRSFWTDDLGVRHYDDMLKPELVAPGNKMVAAESDHNLIVTLHPQLDAGITYRDNRRQMYMNGTSMATPVVAGAAALMLQANPTLTPNMIKAIMTYTAQNLAGANKYEQGAGQLNIEGAVRLARLVRTNLSVLPTLGAPLLTTTVLPAQQSTIAGFTFPWAGKVNLGKASGSGTNLVTKYQKVYGLGVIASDSLDLLDGVIVSDSLEITDGVIVSDSLEVLDGVIVSDGTIVSDGIIVSDMLEILDGVIVSDGIIVADFSLQAQSGTIDGDTTESMELVFDTELDCLDY